MSVVSLTNVTVHNNPGAWDSELQFEIEFEVLAQFDDEIELRLTYIGSPERGSAHDQPLDSVLMGPMNPGAYKILFQADPPDVALIPVDELLGVTGLMLSGHYHEEAFVQVGYYVRIEYDSAELNEAVEQGSPPNPPLRERLVRTIDARSPRVTRYQIDWGMGAGATPAAQAAAEGEQAAGEAMMEEAAPYEQESAAATAAARAQSMSDGVSSTGTEMATTTPPPSFAQHGRADRLMVDGGADAGTDYDGVAAPRIDGAVVPPMPIVGLQ